MLLGANVTSEGLEKELTAAERALAKNERKRLRAQDDQDGLRALERLKELNETVESLELAREVTTWASSSLIKEKEESSEKKEEDVMHDAKQCVALGNLLCRHQEEEADASQGSLQSAGAGQLLEMLWKEEYLPLHTYVRASLLRILRLLLRESGYPSQDACTRLLLEQKHNSSHSDETVASCCYWLTQLQKTHRKLSVLMMTDEDSSQEKEPWDALVEICRPIVDRVRFHFVVESEDRISSTRIDRVPEWLFGYLREHVFEGGPWEFVADSRDPPWVEDAPLVFLNEMLSLAQYVLTERQFFRHDRIAGPDSNPLLLSSAIEQLLQFDHYIRSLVLPEGPQRVPLLGLTHSFVVCDEELWAWWLDRELQSSLSTMFTSEILHVPSSRISPRAELFCSLIHSIRSKAVFLATHAGAYVGHVAVPLCMQFLDAIHGTATDLKGLLSQRKLPDEENLRKNMQEWMELINGTHAAAATLLQGDDSNGSGGDSDLARVGRSFERLRDVLVDECAATLVETILMERAKLASYLMRCSHLLATTDMTPDEVWSPSSDLQDAAEIFSTLLKICRSSDQGDPDAADIEYAPLAIRSNVTDRLAEKFVEVALDEHGMTPDILHPGATIFANDVASMFDDPILTPPALRLLDISRFMAMEARSLRSLRETLFDLSRNPFHPNDEILLLSFASFSSDGTLLDEAASMLRAKGYSWMTVSDAVSILNRRKDSFL